MKVLITGASGFIGTHLVKELDTYGHDVVGVDRADGDLLDPLVIADHMDRHQPEMVAHLAAKVGRAFGEVDPLVTIMDNVGMTALVAKACGERGVQLVYASTSEIYGDIGNATAYEDMVPNLPHNLYGLSKRQGEEVAKLYAPDGLVNLRLSMPFGEGLPAGRGRAAMINFLYNSLRGETITVHKNSERSWCYVSDTVRGIRYIMEEQFDSMDVTSWNVGRDDNALSMLDLAKKACDMTGASYDIIQEVEPPGMQTVVKRLATNKLRSIGWRPEVELEEGMRRTLSWIQQGFPPLI